MNEEIKNIEEEVKEVKKEEVKEEEKKLVLPTWSIDVPLEINRGEK